MNKTTISISKIDNDLLSDYEKNHYDPQISPLEKLIRIINNQINHKMGGHFNVFYKRYEGYDCFLYSTGNPSEWKNFIKQIFTDVDDGFFMTNFPSYLLIKEIDVNIYCVTAGRANTLIEDLKDKLFGVSLFPKLVKDNEEIIRYISDNRVYGKRNASRFSNRTSSNFKYEQNFESIYNELGASIKTDIQKKMGIKPELNVDGSEKSNSILINFGSRIQIGKQMTFDEIDEVIKNVNQILTLNDNFIIHYLVPINKQGVKQSTVDDAFLDYIKDHVDELHIAYDHEINASFSDYLLYDHNNNLIDQNEFNTSIQKNMDSLDDLEAYIKFKLNQSKRPERFLKQYHLIKGISIRQNDYKYTIFSLLNQEFDYKGKRCYLIEGEWFVFIDSYMSHLETAYKYLYKSSEEFWIDNDYANKFNYYHHGLTNEQLLKDQIKNNPLVIDADLKLYKGIELADAILIDTNQIIFMHNKHKFDGSSARDLNGQIETSASIINHYRSQGFDNGFDDYIDKLKIKNPNLTSMIDVFKDLIENPNTKIIYVACFIDQIDISTNSNYIKFIVENTRLKLYGMNIGYYFI